MEYKQFVVCAANRHKELGLIICGARHWDDIMCAVADALELRGIGRGGEWEQGFIDQKGNFLTRDEAGTIVVKNNQPLHGDCVSYLAPKHLFSEHLY